MSSPPVPDRVVSATLIPVLRSRDLHSALVCEAATRLVVWRRGKAGGPGAKTSTQRTPTQPIPIFTHAGPIEHTR
jgi:hypothetical protein